ncbi:2-keto-4-pentenoate hydratase [Pseudooceanicola pacificus]|nr:hydratase [Pseudooceanicola pacificus]
MPETIATDAIEHFADQLAQAWVDRRPIVDAPPVLLTDRQDGYRVQDMMARRIGEPVVGWKAGATSEGMRRRDGHDGIVPGRVFSSGLFVGAAHRLDAASYPGGMLEPEFAYRFLESPGLRTDWTAEDLGPLVAAHVAIEIIGSRMAPALPPECRGTAMTIADNGNGFALVIGPEIATDAEYDPLRHPVDLRIDGGPPARNSPPDIRADPLAALADTVNLLAARGISLDSGNFVTTGSATETLPVQKGSTVTADFGGLGTIRLTFN